MDASTIKSYIQQKNVPDFLIFTGPEWAVQKIYINMIAQVMNLNIKYADGMKDIYGTLQNRSFIATNSLYVIRDDKDIITNEKLQEQIKNGLIGNNILILLLTTVDKRTKFYKAYKDTITEFEPLKPSILAKYIQKEISLSDKHIEKLMEVCEYDYGRCLLEIDKIKQCMKATRAEDMPNNTFGLLMSDGTIYQPPKDAIFDLVDAILDRKVNESFDLLRQSYAVGEATMVMLSVLYNNAKAVLQVQSCSSSDISKSTGLTGWQINNAKKHCGKYSISELVDIMRIVQQCEKGIKTGEIEEQYVMEYILTSIL